MSQQGAGQLSFCSLNDLSWKVIWAFWSVFWKSNHEFLCISGGCSTMCCWCLCFNKFFRTSGCWLHTWKYQEKNSFPRDLELMYKLQQQLGWFSSWLWQYWSRLQTKYGDAKRWFRTAVGLLLLCCAKHRLYTWPSNALWETRKSIWRAGGCSHLLRLCLLARVFGSALVSPEKIRGSSLTS